MTAPVLSVRDLVVEFDTPHADRAPLRVIDGVSFDVVAGEVLGIVGESGSGKSVTMLAVMGLLPGGQARIASGEVWFNDTRIDTLPFAGLSALRGGAISMIFQDPMTSLNPVSRVGRQIAEAIRLHQPDLNRAGIKDRVMELLDLVGVPDAATRMRQFPHEFSGGMRQRVMIAMAIANEPKLLIADEPTTALDVTIQAQVMDLLAEVRERTSASMILITHDLGLVAEVADRVAVMYSGRIAEMGPVDALFDAPAHPYTAGLMRSLPILAGGRARLWSIPGQPPDVFSRPSGCAFHPRCSLAQEHPVCAADLPQLSGPKTHRAACHFAADVPAWIAAEDTV
jgi:peptide/nickel transport system ATP-binding protein